MYQIGDLVFYGSTGVCKVADITARTMPGYDRPQDFYVLEHLYQQNYTILAPVNQKKVFIRPIISKSKARELMDTIPTIGAPAYYNCSLSQLSKHYDAFLETHECLDLMKLTISIYTKKQVADAKQRKFGSVDEKYMKRAEDLLFGELAAALDVSRSKVSESVAGRLNLDRGNS